MSDSWDPEQYHRYRALRRRPFEVLLAGVPRERPVRRAVDLGCGSGELTRALHEHLGGAQAGVETVGVDRSAAMLEAAEKHAGDGLSFVQADLVGWLEADTTPLEVIFSNAAFHWIEDQRGLYARLHARLAPGGLLAVQVPANDHHVSHTTLVEVASEPPFAEALGGFARRSPVLAPQAYALLLDELGFTDIDVRLQVFPQYLDAPQDVVEWLRGTTLTPYRSRLPEALYEELVARYRERLLARLPARRPCFYPFDRIFVWARRSA